MSQEPLILKEVRGLISCIVNQNMLTIADICKNNTSEWDRYYRVVIRDIARGPSFYKYKRSSYVVAHRILMPGEKLIGKNRKHKRSKIIVFNTYQECVNFTNAYNTDIIVGYLQKVCVNRHNPIDFIPVFDGDFTKPWSNDAIEDYLGISPEDAKVLMWDDEYENPIFSITGDKNTGIKYSSKNCLAKGGEYSMKKTTDESKPTVASTKPSKKFSSTKYRRENCKDTDELRELQEYVLSETEAALKLLPDDLKALVLKSLQRKFKQQISKFSNKSKETESIDTIDIEHEETTVEVNALENAVTNQDISVVQSIKTYDDIICPITNTRAKGSVFYIVTSRRIQIIPKSPGIIKMVNRLARGSPLLK